MKEIWKDIRGHEGRYQVSDRGRVRSLDRITVDKRGRNYRWSGTPLKHSIGNHGYPVVALSMNGVASLHLVHRLVLLTFVGDPDEGMECCHADGCRTNNHLSNLRWGTAHANQADRLNHGTSNRGEQNGQSKLCEIDVRLIRSIDGHGTGLADFFGISPQSVCDIQKRRTWRHIT